VTVAGLAINLLLAAMKAVLGILGRSQALVADAVHSVSDMVTDIAVLFGSAFWSAPADENHPYGHGRIETLVTAFIGLALAVVGTGLGYHALATLSDPDPAGPSFIVFLAACVSILVKEALYRWTATVGRRVRSAAVMANAWHHRSDALSSVPVAVAILGSRLRPSWTFLDHVAAVLVSVFILAAAWKISWPALKELTDAGVSSARSQRYRKVILEAPGARTAHALRTRQLGPGVLVDFHLHVDPEMSVSDGHRIAHEVKDRLMRECPEIVDVLVHVEPGEPAGRRA
jgi:cation diffusion facilitator family transporter